MTWSRCLSWIFSAKSQVNFSLLIKCTIFSISLFGATFRGLGFKSFFIVFSKFRGASSFDYTWANTLIFICSWTRSQPSSQIMMSFSYPGANRKSLRTRISKIWANVVSILIYWCSIDIIVRSWSREINFIMIFICCRQPRSKLHSLLLNIIYKRIKIIQSRFCPTSFRLICFIKNFFIKFSVNAKSVSWFLFDIRLKLTFKIVPSNVWRYTTFSARWNSIADSETSSSSWFLLIEGSA